MIRYATKDILLYVQAESLVSKLMYSIEGIVECYLEHETQDIVIHVSDESSLSEINEVVIAMIQVEEGIRTMKSRIIHNNRGSIDTAINHLSDYGSEVELVYVPDGTIKRDSAVRLLHALDIMFVGLAEIRNAGLREYPSMIAISTLDTCGYIQSFPQNIFLVSEIPHRYEQLRKVKETEDINQILRTSSYALSPAVCFHCYAELAGTTIAKPTLLTAMGNCFRHEAPWRVGNHRLNEFSMREVVFIGDPEFVEVERLWWMQEIWRLFSELGLLGTIETANDLFYFSEDSLKKQQQQMASMKYELIVQLRKGSSFSIASFNNIRDSLCRPFRVHDPAGKPVHSGCVAFGIDRWVYALLSEYGSDIENWPMQVRKIVAM